ncbi:MAG: DUF1206 domain-containing protein [Planctomycetota bacterium]|jgi:hypothetical protein
MGDAVKKLLKAQAKRAKKQAKAALKAATAQPPAESSTPPAGPTSTAPEPPSVAGSSPGVRFAESVRGIIYIVGGASLVVALILGHRGTILSLDDIIDSLFAARAGKIILSLIALALVIYGLKHLRVVR